MEIQIRELIDQIRKDGVDAAEAEADAILTAARTEADAILADARARADKLLADAEAENRRMVRSSEEAIGQAGRNVLLSFRESVSREVDALLRAEVDAAYSPDRLPQLIADAVAAWAQNGDADSLSVILTRDSLNALEGSLTAALQARMLGGVTLKAADNLDGGFRIAVENGAAYYDYSADAVVELLSAYLTPKVAELLRKA